MRNVLLLFFFFLFAFRAFSQTNLPKQIKNIIADSSHDFKNYKGSFLNLQGEDSVFVSAITIEDTKANDIFYNDNMVIYRATITDSVGMKKGKKIIDKWKNSLQEILSDAFNIEPVKIVEWNPSQYGWSLERGDVSVSIDLFPRELNSKIYFVSLSISRYHFDSYNHKLK